MSYTNKILREQRRTRGNVVPVFGSPRKHGLLHSPRADKDPQPWLDARTEFRYSGREVYVDTDPVPDGSGNGTLDISDKVMRAMTVTRQRGYDPGPIPWAPAQG